MNVTAAAIVRAAEEIIAERIAEGADHLIWEARDRYMAGIRTARAWVRDANTAVVSLPGRHAHLAGDILDAAANRVGDADTFVDAHIWPHDDGATLTLCCGCAVH